MPSRAKRPNLVFVTTDHQRADSLGMQQAGLEVTPHLNRLAARSIVFERAYTTCPLCVPARTALATSRYPTSNGVVFNDWHGRNAGDDKPIHQVLAEHGYEMAHVGIHHVRLDPDLRQRVAFKKWLDGEEYDRRFQSLQLDPVLLPAVEGLRKEVREYRNGAYVPARYSNHAIHAWPYPEDAFRDVCFCCESVDFITRAHSGPFALFVCFWAPHPPLIVPEKYLLRFPPESLSLPGNIGRPADGEPENRRKGVPAQLAAGVTMDMWQKTWSAHLGLVNMADALVGRILAALARAGLDRNTVILMTSDHGDHLGQHGMYQKMEMYEQAVRVPMILHLPGVAPRTIREPVSHLDVVPTLLDLMDIDVPGAMEGASLADAIRDRAPVPERPVFCQYSGNPTLGDIRRAVMTMRYKYIYDPNDHAELYDLMHDPLETRNLARDGRGQTSIPRLHGQLRSWHVTHGDWIHYGHPRAGGV